jgi:hypothetical protein
VLSDSIRKKTKSWISICPQFDFKVDRIEIDDRIYALKRSILPFFNERHDLVGEIGLMLLHDQRLELAPPIARHLDLLFAFPMPPAFETAATEL